MYHGRLCQVELSRSNHMSSYLVNLWSEFQECQGTWIGGPRVVRYSSDTQAQLVIPAWSISYHLMTLE